MRIGFLVAGNDVHHVAHILPMAKQLARMRPDWLVYVLTTGRYAADEVDRHIGDSDASPAHLRLSPTGWKDFSARDPKAVMRESDVLDSLDTLVVTRVKAASDIARRRTRPRRIIHAWAGAKDHTIPETYREGPDHILVPGEKARAWLTDCARIDPARISVVGCSKIESSATPAKAPFATDGRQIVLYNPYYSAELSSWHRWGKAILNWFVEHDDYLLIFAPHIGLFERRLVWPKGKILPVSTGRVEERYRHAPNIHIDLGSQLSTARAYTELADIYVGDAGSQLYEYIARPRPCAFLNAHRVRTGIGDPRFANWDAGHVIDDVGMFGALLRTAQEWHPDVYRPIQLDMVAHSISTTEVPAPARAAEAIVRVSSG